MNTMGVYSAVCNDDDKTCKNPDKVAIPRGANSEGKPREATKGIIIINMIIIIHHPYDN